MDRDKYQSQRARMINQDIIRRGISNTKLISAMKKIKRELFVPQKFRDESYRDGPIPIGFDQTISQPFIVAYMTDLLDLAGDEKILELGTGSGYQTAVLCEMAREIFSIEIVEELYLRSSELLLKRLKYKNLFLKRADGRAGWKKNGPYDRILLTAAPNKVPDDLFEQLNINGILVAPVGNFIQNIKYYKKNEEAEIIKTDLIGVSFVPLR